MKKAFLICVLIFASCEKGGNKKKIANGKHTDSIIYSETRDGNKMMTIFYPSKQKDSFKLRSLYINGKIVDSMYKTNNGYISGKAFSYKDDGTTLIYEHLNVNGDKSVNQFWGIKNKDTLSNYGNYYELKILDSIKINKYFKVELLLKKSYNDKFLSLFFLTPKGHYSNLKSDFSNIKEVEFDTIQNLLNDDISKNSIYKEDFWNKRTIIYKTGFADSGVNHIRGILVERKDTLYTDRKGNVFKYLDRYLYINEEVYVNGY